MRPAVAVGLLLTAGCAAGQPGSRMALGAAAASGSVASAALSQSRDLPPDPPPASPLMSLERNPASGGDGPIPPRTVHFDVDALPVASWGPPTKRDGFFVRREPHGYLLTTRSEIFAEVVISQPGNPFIAFTGGSFGAGAPPTCAPAVHSGATVPTHWTGFGARGGTDEGSDVEMGRGTFDLATCNATPLDSLSVRGKAIVPGYVYGVVVRKLGDTVLAPGESSRDELVLFLPRGTFVSATGDPNVPLNAAATGTFTRLTFPLERGNAGSASVTVTPAALGLWGELRRTGRPVWSFQEPPERHDDLVVAIDVACQGQARSGSVSIALARRVDAKPYAAILAANPQR